MKTPPLPEDFDEGRHDDGLASMIAAGATIQDCMEVYGISQRTVYRRLEQPEVRRHIRRLRALAVGRAVGILAAAAGPAADTLRGQLTHGDPHLEQKAASAILDKLPKLGGYGDLEGRIADLEDQAMAQQGTPVTVAARLAQLPPPGNGHGGNGAANGNGHPPGEG